MPFNGSGNFSIINTFVPNTTILSAAVNQNFTDIASGLSDCLTRDGQAGMTAAFKAIAGSLSAPGISFTSDATSGLYLSSSGILGMVSHSLGMLLNTTLFGAISATVQAGGSGYAVGDTITETGGTAVSQAVFTVGTVSSGAVTAVSVAYPGFYSVKPSNPVSQGSTSGIGTGCTLNITYNDVAGGVYRALFTDQTGSISGLYQKLGLSDFVNGLMTAPNALAFAQGIGSTALTTVIGGAFLIPPQGTLSPLSSATAPIPTSDQTAATRIYWTPYNGNVCPIYNGTQFVLTTSSQIFCDLTVGAQVLGGIYDVYKFLNSGVVTLGLGPSWAAGTAGSVTVGSCVRGTGAGGAALSLLNGLYVNTAAMTLNNGATTYSIAANQATYLGSVYIIASAGAYNCHVSYGQNRVWGLWNNYNRRSIILQAGDPTASWNYTTNTARASNGSSSNAVIPFVGLPDQEIDLNFTQSVSAGSSTGTTQVIANWQVGIGWNSTTTFSGGKALGGARIDGSGIDLILQATSVANYLPAPFQGINVATSLEQTTGSSGSPSVNYQGTAAGMLLKAVYLG